MIFIHGLRDIPHQFLMDEKSYSISYTFLGQNVKYSLNLSKAEDFQNMLKLKLDKMKVMYFFSESREQIVEFIKSQSKIKVDLFEDNEIMGSLDLELDDFKSDKVIKKDYYKMFSGPKVFPYLSWGIFVSLGLN